MIDYKNVEERMFEFENVLAVQNAVNTLLLLLFYFVTRTSFGDK